MITTIGWTNFRGTTGRVDLADLNIISGPNGSGKSTIAAAAQYNLLGLIPGFRAKEAFANASGSTMGTAVEIDGKQIVRGMAQGQSSRTLRGTLRETLSIDGNTGSGRTAGASMLRVALGRQPRVMNMPEFYAMTSTEQRRKVIGLVTDPDEYNRLMDEEAAARQLKNDLMRDKQVANKAVESLTFSMADKEKPTGNLAHMQEELAAARAERDTLVETIESGKANDRARVEFENLINSIPDLEKNLAAGMEQLQAQHEVLDAAGDDLAEIDEYAPLPQPGELTEAINAYTALAERVAAIDGSQPPLPEFKGEKNLSANAIKVIKGVAGFLRDESATAQAAALESLLPDEAAVKEYSEAVAKWSDESVATQKAFSDAQITARKLEEAYMVANRDHRAQYDAKKSECERVFMDVRSKIEQILATIQTVNASLDAAKGYEESMKRIGVGLDPNDVASLAGLDVRLADLEAKIKPLMEYDVLVREIERARLTAEEASGKVAEANGALQEKIAAQQAVVEQAGDVLAERSKEVLPSGYLILEDDGKEITISWRIDESRTIQRQTLSGGEKAPFDVGFGHAMSPEALIVMEAAELDEQNTQAIMKKLAAINNAKRQAGKDPMQVVMLTCHEPACAVCGHSSIEHDNGVATACDAYSLVPGWNHIKREIAE